MGTIEAEVAEINSGKIASLPEKRSDFAPIYLSDRSKSAGVRISLKRVEIHLNGLSSFWGVLYFYPITPLTSLELPHLAQEIPINSKANL